MAKIEKARFWMAVMYPENMREDWADCIGDTLQYPYAYCLHTADKDTKSDHRNDHIHVIVAFPNTTTYKHAMTVFSLLSAEGKKALNKVEACVSVRNCYDYLIHDTEDSRKKGKELYAPECRITGNNFDIGAYEQLGLAEKNEICKEIALAIIENNFITLEDVFLYVLNFEDSNYFDVFKTYNSLFERLTNARYQNWVRSCGESPSQAKHHENTTEPHENCCPDCGSLALAKDGRTQAGRARMRCKCCGKRFVLG